MSTEALVFAECDFSQVDLPAIQGLLSRISPNKLVIAGSDLCGLQIGDEFLAECKGLGITDVSLKACFKRKEECQITDEGILDFAFQRTEKEVSFEADRVLVSDQFARKVAQVRRASRRPYPFRQTGSGERRV